MRKRKWVLASEESGHMPDRFDRLMGALHGLPDVVHTKSTTIHDIEPLLGTTETFIVRTYRQRDRGDTIFLEAVSRGSVVRLALPAKVADAIARQRESLTTMTRRKVGKAQAAERKARGEKPAFLRPKAVK